MNYSVSKIQLLSSGVVVFYDSRNNIIHTDKNLKQFIPKGRQYIEVDCSCQDMFFDVWSFSEIITPVTSASYTLLDKYTASTAAYQSRLQAILSFLTEYVTKACCESSTSSDFIPFPYSYSESGVSSGDWNYGSSSILSLYSISLIGQDLTGYLAELDNGGYITFSNVADPTTFSVFRITSGSYFLASGIITFTGATLICSGGAFVEGDRSNVIIDLGSGGSGGGVESVTGDLVDNTDPLNPIVDTATFQEVLTEGSTLTGNNTVNGGGFQFTFSSLLRFFILTTQRITSQVNDTLGGISSVILNPSQIVSTAQSTTGISTITQEPNFIDVDSTHASFQGVKYNDDYSANYTNRSLVDKEYVDTRTFTDLTDVPNTYSGAANDLVRVNAAENGLEFLALSTVSEGLINLSNPSAVRYIRINADNTVTAIPTSSLPVGSFIKSTTSTTHTGNTTETVLYSVLIPANTIIAGDIVKFFFGIGGTNNANIKTFRIKVNTTNTLVGATTVGTLTITTNTIQGAMGRVMVVDTTTSSRVPSATTSIANEYSSTNAAQTTLSTDWTVDQYLLFSVQLANNTDSAYVLSVLGNINR